MILRVLVWVFAVIVVTGALGFLVIEAMDRVESIRKRAPWIPKILERRDAFVALLLICAVLLIGDGYELLTKEIAELPAAPNVTFPAPLAPHLEATKKASPGGTNLPVGFLQTAVTSLAKYAINERLAAALQYGNAGQSIVTKAGGMGVLYIVDTKPVGLNGESMVSVAEQEMAYKKFWDNFSRGPGVQTFVIGEIANTTAYGPLLDVNLDRELKGVHAAKAILLTGVYKWTDGSGAHVNQLCRWLQPGFDITPGTAQMWQGCTVHNGLLY